MKKLLFVILLLGCNPAWSEMPIKLVIPFSPGGIADVIARQLQIDLSQELHRVVVVEYKPGASGSIAIEYVANSPTNQTVLLLTGNAVSINSAVKQSTIFEDKLNHLITLGTSPMILVASKKLKVDNLKEFVALSKTNITYATTGVASASHLAGEILKQSTGKNLIHIPYKSLAQPIPDLINGDVDLEFVWYSIIISYIQTGQVVPLAVGSNERLKDLPTVPTFREFKYYDAEYKDRFAIFSNKDGKDPDSRAIIKAYQKILTDPNTNISYQKIGLTIELPVEINNTNYIVDLKKHYKNLLENIHLQ
jgi:tripartite-type tricarboxylate transporter receptor subunit TctC